LLSAVLFERAMTSTLEAGMFIHQNRDWLGGDLVDRCDEALSAHEERKYPLSVIKAGASLEGILKLLLAEWRVTTPDKRTLGPLIGDVRDTKGAPDELLERLNEANNIRNRASHNKTLALSAVTEGDSLQIISILTLVADWCRGQFHSIPTLGKLPDAPPIFLSVGGAHRLDQQQFLEHLRASMRSFGVELRSISATEYSEEKPFGQAR
jgi:hypothetical protein